MYHPLLISALQGQEQKKVIMGFVSVIETKRKGFQNFTSK